MKAVFSKDSLWIGINRIQENKLSLSISSVYSESDRKSELYVNENQLAKIVENFWKSIKTKNLLSMELEFGEIDWYDNMTDMYETPIIHIQRGLKKARIGHHHHGSIPKEWEVIVSFIFSDTTKNTPILEVVKSALGTYFNADAEKEFVKLLKPLLQKKINSEGMEIE